MDRQIQKSYNWAYLAIRHAQGAKWLFLRALERQQSAGRHMRALGLRVAQAAKELEIVSAQAGAPVLASAAEAVAQSVRDIETAATSSDEGDATAASQAWIGAMVRLERTKRLLDQNSPIRFRPWFVNPGSTIHEASRRRFPTQSGPL